MSKKIIGVTVGTALPKPNFDQTDPKKGDYIKGDRSFLNAIKTINGVGPDSNGDFVIAVDDTLTQAGVAADAKVVGESIEAVNNLVGDVPVATQIADAITAIPQADWNQNDEAAPDYVKNRTHYGSEHILTIDEDFVNSAITIDGSEFKDSEGNTYINLVKHKWVRISELTPSLDTLWNTGYVRRTNATSGCPIPSWGVSILWDTDDFYAIGSTMRVTYGYLFVVFKAGATISFGSSAGTAQDKYKAIAPEPGIYMNVDCSPSTGEYTPLLEYIKWGKLVQLDEKYIPSTIARVSDIPAIDPTLTIEGAAADAKVVGDLWRLVADDDDVIWLLAELGLIQRITDETGVVLTDEVGNILLL